MKKLSIGSGGNTTSNGLHNKLEETNLSNQTSDRQNCQSARLNYTSHQTSKARLSSIVQHTRKSSGYTTATNNIGRKNKNNSATRLNVVHNVDPNEVTFKMSGVFEASQLETVVKNREKELHQEISKHYEDLFVQRTQETKVELQKRIREEVEQEMRIEYLAQMRLQREILRKEIRQEVVREMEDSVSKEVERRMHENFLEWEEEYKRKKIDSMKD